MKRELSTRACSRSWIRKTCLIVLCLASVAAAAAEAQKKTERQTPTQTRTAPARRTSPARLQPIQLPEPAKSSAVSFEQVLIEMQKTQPPDSQKLDLAKISQLAWAIRNALPPSAPVAAGQTSVEPPMRAFFILPEGVFTYEPVGHVLQPISDEDARATLATALLKQTVSPIGGCQIIVTGSARDFTARYGTRGRMVMAMQAGRISQNLQLEAVARGLTFLSIDAVEGGDVRRVARIPRNYEPLYVAIVGYPAGQAADTAAQPATSRPGRTVLLVVAPVGFQDEELFATRQALEMAGAQVAVASTRTGLLAGMLGGTAQANVLLNQANADDFDAVVFIGGVGAREYVGNSVAQNLARQASVRHKVLAAIGTAPSVLAAAGVVRGVRTTAYITEQERMVRAGAVYTGNAAEKDGLIITATGAAAVPLFTQAIIEALGEVSP